MYNHLFKLQEDIFKALAHSRRLEIIHLLRDQELSVSEIYQMLDLPQANVSQHLQVLRDSGIVSANKIGKQVSYRIIHPEFLQIADLIRELLIKQHTNDTYADDLEIDMQDLVPLTHDVVCQMRVSPKTAGFVHEHLGERYYFCASGCLELFKKKPETYIGETRKK